MTRDQRFAELLKRSGRQFEPTLMAGGNYVTTRREGNVLYVAGQIPKDAGGIAFTGRVGADVDLATAQAAAALCALRALAAVRESLGSLEGVRAVLKLNVFMQTSAEFTQHAEVGDGASNLLIEVLGEAGRHPRTSVGVYTLPKNVPVEIDLVLAVG